MIDSELNVDLVGPSTFELDRSGLKGKGGEGRHLAREVIQNGTVQQRQAVFHLAHDFLGTGIIERE